MSHRAIQRLRREREAEILASVNNESDDDNEDDSSDEENIAATKKSNVFAAAMFDDDSDDDSESDSDDHSEENSFSNDEQGDREESTALPAVMKQGGNKQTNTLEVEDLDTLLEEYKLQDKNHEVVTGVATSNEQAPCFYDIITSRMEVRDLDIEHVRRSLFGGLDGAPASSARRNHRQHNVFGTLIDNWPRPPHYVGGGIGMKSYCDNAASSSSKTLPWPYCDMKEGDARCPPIKKWIEFVYSDSYLRDYEDMKTIQASGDPNALALFVAHHPFVVEALLQLSIVMYQMNQSREGLSFLKRALWVFECAAPNSFLKVSERCALMDCQKDANKPFFSTLFRLLRVSYVGGLTRTSLASAQFLLSLDPLCDPMNILLSMDHFAVKCNTESCNSWIVDFVESDKVSILYRDDENHEVFECQLRDLPNWSFSYALALFNLYKSTSSEAYSKERADNAIRTALCQFPSVIGQLLEKNDVDIKSRSLRTDWPTVIEFIDDLICQFQKNLSNATKSDPAIRAYTSQAYDTIVRIFVQQNFKSWSSFAVMKWMYENLVALKEETKIGEGLKVSPPSPAMMRYAKANPTDYEDKFQTMPAEANPFDPNIIALALNVDPNRRRLVQRNPRHAGADLMDMDGVAFANRNQYFAGPPTVLIDPDLPLLEVFWRSALPWVRVEGVPPPNR